jgi:Domain of Unknown Function (DUF1080)
MMRWRGLAVFVLVGLCSSSAFSQNDKWLPNGTERPAPGVVSPSAHVGGAPSDAIILFDGKNLDAWVGRDGKAPQWQIKDGTMEIAPGTGNINTKQGFGDCQLHVEWMEPSPATGSDQSRGNSGIMLMSMYELQVLDMWQNPTYADGGAGAIYGQYPPLVTASRKPGEWQTYDIMFRRARFDSSGHLTSPARFTVIQNGILVQDNTQPTGPTAFHDRPPYIPGPEKLPLMLQDHGSAVRYRNMWIRELPDKDPDLHFTTAVPVNVDPKDMALYAGHYDVNPTSSIDFQISGNKLTAQTHNTGAGRGGRGGAAGAAGQAAPPAPAQRFQQPPVELVPVNHDVFIGEWSGNSMRVTFTRGADRAVTGVIVQQADTYHYAQKVQ